VLSPGDRLMIRGDSDGQQYLDSFSLPIDGTEGSPITVMAYLNEKVVITGTSEERLNINKDYWDFESLIFDQASIYADAIKINGNYINLRKLVVRNGQREGISVEKASFITIEDSYVHNFMFINSDGVRKDAHCIMITTYNNDTFSDIKILRNTIERCSGDGIQIFGWTGQSVDLYAKNIEITGNTFIDGTAAGSGLTENALDFKAGKDVLVKNNTMRGYTNSKTIVVQKSAENIVIEGNIISDGDRGIEMREEGVDGEPIIFQKKNTIKNNVIYNMSGYALRFDGVIDLTVVNNTLVNIGGNSFGFEGSSVIGGTIKNNLVYQSGSPRIKDAFSNLDIAYNGWFQASAGGMSQVSDTTGSNPLFVEESTNNYRLQSISTAVNAGVNVGTAFFESAPDLGAFEYNPGGDITAPDAPTGVSIE